jgi:DedD protein
MGGSGEHGNGSGETRQVEVQLQGRHLALAVTGLAVFGAVLFLLGRWSERAAHPAPAPAEEVVDAESPLRMAPPAAAPRELTFYETLGKKESPAFREAAKTSSRSEPPPELPGPAARETGGKPAESGAGSAASSPPAGERFQVQVAATRDARAARELAERLRRKGYEARVEATRDAGGTPQYKVRIGDYADREPAERMAEQIRTREKVGAWIVRVSG